MSIRNRQWLLASRPEGWVQESNFRLAETGLPQLQDGQVLVKVHYLSLDPYMRGRMNASKSYAASQPLNQVMVGGTVGEILESKNENFKTGEMVVGMGGWQEYFVSDGGGLTKVDTRLLPPSVYLGCLGMTGITAWYGLTQICQPKAGGTLVVSAASGAVGSVVGQLGKILGCRVVGIAGGTNKCSHLVKDLGFDHGIDHKSESFADEFTKATPNGIDALFENVGGAPLDASLERMNDFGRVAVCGLIAHYNSLGIALKNFGSILTHRLHVRGFIISDHVDIWPQALKELGGYVAQGRIKYRETIGQGIESAPRAFIGLLKGENLGKQLVKM